MSEPYPGVTSGLKVLDIPSIDAASRMTTKELLGFASSVGQCLHIQVTQLNQYHTAELLKNGLLLYVHLTNLDQAAVKLSSLNRRFYRAAHRLGITVNDIVMQLIQEERLVSIHFKNNHMLIAKCFLNFLGESHDGVVNPTEAIENVFERQQALCASGR